MPKKDLLNDLNDKQREAVTAPMGPVLVLAGAGSGKTRALTYRIAYLVREHLVKPENILAVTFTNKAAGEMKERVQNLLHVSSSKFQDNITMGTFHSICARILRAEIAKLGMGLDGNFTIYDAEDTRGLLKQIILELDLDREYKPRLFSYYISRAKNLLTEPRKLDIGKDYLRELVQRVYGIYQSRLRANNAVDFDDLLMMTVLLFQSPSFNSSPLRGEGRVGGILEKYRYKYRYILVDEYQDTNHAQYMLLKLLSEKHQNIFVVGDDAQSIYGFRGANMRNILNFSRDYKKAKVVLLEQNYRSTGNILNSANKVIQLNKYQYEKDLWTENLGGEKVGLYEAEDEVDESEQVINRIVNYESPKENKYPSGQAGIKNDDVEYEYEEDGILDRFVRSKHSRSVRYQIPPPTGDLPKGENIKYQIPDNLREQVILYRTHAQSRAFEEACMNAGVPYQIVGGIRFYERREIKDALSYLRLLLNPRDLVSLSRVINVPARGIGAMNFKAIKQGLKKYKFDFARLLNNLGKLALSAKAEQGARDFFAVLDKAGSLPEKKNILEVFDLVLKASGFKDHILDGTEEGELRWENIEELINVAAKFKSMPWQEALRKFLEEVALMTDMDRKDEGQNRLTMMTLHSAKGLEFDKVFFVGLEEGLLPHTRSIMNPEEIAEEVRLAYVGMTRARKELFLSYAKRRTVYGELKRSVPSRILKAIPIRLLRKLN